MRVFLIVLFGSFLVAMIAVTTYASLDRSILNVPATLTSEPWFHATLADAYIGFLTIYVWVAFRERGIWRKIVWFVLIMLLGNIAISIYVLIQLALLKNGEGLSHLLLAKPQPDT